MERDDQIRRYKRNLVADRIDICIRKLAGFAWLYKEQVHSQERQSPNYWDILKPARFSYLQDQERRIPDRVPCVFFEMLIFGHD